MLSKEEYLFVYEHAYIPEHLPHYVTGISDKKPFLHMNCMCFVGMKHLTFVGFPLVKEEGIDLGQIYESACQRFGPESVSIIAPRIWLAPGSYDGQPRDHYYRLELPPGKIPADLDYMLRRAKRELRVARGDFGREHKRLIREFLKGHALSPAQRTLFKRIPNYLKNSTSAHLLEARRGKDLIAFTIVDTGSADYAFYLFSFRTTAHAVPGASDLLFYEMVLTAESLGKKAINLGLGINNGIRRFKEKWGGVPFLSYESAHLQRLAPRFEELAHKL
ncbi:MAG: hypothetical protein JRJ03_07470 [Deltaproteobacteria bacterium]|nr:hypothetical protein [Deltaproteobacteria bacterium]